MFMRLNMQSKELHMAVNVSVFIPDMAGSVSDTPERPYGYAPGMKFQTLLLLHGGSDDDLSWTLKSSVIRYAQEHKLALVMPAALLSSYADTAYGQKWYTFISEEMQTTLRAIFPLSCKRDDNFVAGLSMGAIGAMKIAVNHPERYRAAVCLSGYANKAETLIETFDLRKPIGERTGGLAASGLGFTYGSADELIGSPDDVWGIAEKKANEGVELSEFFYAVGKKDFCYDGVCPTADGMAKLGYTTHYFEDPDYGHEWPFWDKYIKIALDDWLPLKNEPIY